ncbi:abc multidrug transporter protein [Penicillium canariense]|uniref:Abc multidrug transporter protein n=1 Tax=Penicillium canariense TaxID=189055 RepID=A0A9W9LF52_9EURO|nr:abc multidrug transporter protein [Penicillium canariense]KAJ5153186.1 abc multidrug transporter protein [Penicillium canariense]
MSEENAKAVPSDAPSTTPSTVVPRVGLLGRLIGSSRKGGIPIPQHREPSPEYHAGILSRLTFSWMSSLMFKGYTRPLEVNDIWLVNPDRTTHKLAAELKVNFQSNIDRKSKRPLLRAIWQTFRKDAIIGAAAAFLSSSCQVIMPLVVKYIITFAEEAYYGREPPIGRGVGLVICLTCLQVLASFGNAHMFYRGMMMGAQTRCALISIIFDKAMTISGRAKVGNAALEPVPANITPGSDEERDHFARQLEKDPKGNQKDNTPRSSAWPSGRIINIMSVDTYRIDQACGWFHVAWSNVLGIIVTIVLLLLNLSYSALPGIGIFVLSLPISMVGMLAMFRQRKVINKTTDERITITQDLLSTIRFVKYYAWEGDFLQRLARMRKKEIGGIRRILAIRNGLNTFGTTTPVLAAIVAFIVYFKTQNNLSPASVFSSLALFNQLRMPLMFVPFILAMIADALQSIDRIEEFLEAEDGPVGKASPKSTHISITMKDAAFTWEQSTPPDPNERLRTTELTEDEMRDMKLDNKDGKKGAKKTKKGVKDSQKKEKAHSTPSEITEEETTPPDTPPFSMHGINLHIEGPELIGIIGTVGSGKSSLLSAVAGEMRRTAGEFTTEGRRALCAQVPWIQSTTIRENITFGQEFDQAKYDAVIDACALQPDLSILPHGSFTEIGEKGINLSGGQKHRVSLARAIYFDPDIIILDDPLAAVDAETGGHLMEHAICGLLKDTCRLLATHQVQLLHRCDRIIVMDNGRIMACDTLDNLMKRNDVSMRILQTVQMGVERESADIDASRDTINKPGALEVKSEDAIMQEEDRQVKGISWEVYKAYASSMGSMLVPIFVLATLMAYQACNIVTGLWLAWWSSDEYSLGTNSYIGIYVALGVAQSLLQFVSMLALSTYGTEASKRMYQQATKNLMHAPVAFFDTTPVGRIMNRFSKDVDVMDNNLSESVRMAATTLLTVLSIVGLTVSYFYYFAIALVPVLLIYAFASSYYRASAREIKRIEGMLRSPVFALFSEAVSGTITLRAYGETGNFSSRIVSAIDDMASAYYLTCANQRWLSLRVDIVGIVFLLVTGMLVITNKFNVSPSISGLVLSYLVSITQTLLFSVRQVAEVENSMTCVERIHYYSNHIPQEASDESSTTKVEENWPAKGEIIFKGVQARYRPALPLVIHDLNLHVRPGERLGVAGRTGAGKSSIMAVLFRIVEPSAGSITIDGVDVSGVRLHDLRSRMSIVPQDATVVRGTVRSNLDPFHKKSDEELWEALQRSHLTATPRNDQASQNPSTGSTITLDTVLEPEGSNLSHGQRQLLALARALVRDSQIIVADEATSSVDLESDAAIQHTIATAFRGKTLLCIAHRLRTIIGYDRVCVMDEGRVAQLGEPLTLYDDEDGRFRKLCNESRITRDEVVAATAAAAGARTNK